MPEISRFFGIIIGMFYDEHNPPHFHARYGSIGLRSLSIPCQFLLDACRRACLGW